MDSFALFSILFFIIAMVFLIGILLGIRTANQKKKSIRQPIQYLTYNRQQFDRAFTFVCEYCGSTVTTKNPKCLQCGGAYDTNTEYRNKKKAIEFQYLDFLKKQEEAIKQEIAYIEATVDALHKNTVMKNTFFNFDLGAKPVYRPVANFEFTCEYCGTKLSGRSTDNGKCSNCGAEYSDNVNLLVMEEEQELEKCHYEEYLRLKDIEWNQNIENETRDAFFTKHAKSIALFLLLLIVVIVCVIYKICMGSLI